MIKNLSHNVILTRQQIFEMKNLLFIFLIILTSTISFSQEVKDFKIKTSKNATERKAILDLLRKEILKDINQEVVFNVKHLKISENYAWFEGDALRKDGKAIQFPDETYDCCHVEGLFEKLNGKWKIVESGLFSTDCWYCGLSQRYPKVPKVIFTEGPLLN